MAQAVETIEAVIISGPRKGELITVPKSELELTPDEESLLNSMIADAQRAAESTQAATAEAETLLRELRQGRGRK
jgi:hypothetical protein